MVFDILFLLFISIGFYWGYTKGIIYSVFSLVAYFLGVILALKFSFLAVKFLSNTVHLSPKVRSVVAFVLVFLVVVLLVRLIAWGLEQILKDFSLNSVNKIVGGCLHALVGVYVLCVFIWFLNKWDIIPKSQKEDSHVYPYVSNLAPSVIEFSGTIVPFFKDTFHSFEELLDKQAATQS